MISTVAPELGDAGSVLNVNADTAAAALAVALQASRLVILTDVEGLYANWPDRSSLISSISATELRALLPGLEAGMIPKMGACLKAVDGGVQRAAHRGRAQRALDAAGNFHHRRQRHPGCPRRGGAVMSEEQNRPEGATEAGAPEAGASEARPQKPARWKPARWLTWSAPEASGGRGRPGSGEQWLARYSHSLMGVFGTPQRVLVRGAGAWSGTPTARSTWTCWAASRSTRWAMPTRSSPP